MNAPMTNERLDEIRARHERAAGAAGAGVAETASHQDRGVLLAEVERLRTERDEARAKLEAVLATKVPEIEAALTRFRQAVGVVGPMPSKPPTSDPADVWIAWRGSVTDFVTDMKAAIPPSKLPFLRAHLGVDAPLTEAEAQAWAERWYEESGGSEPDDITSFKGAVLAASRGDIPPEVRPLEATR